MSDKLAEVVELTERKTAKVKFDGEETPSEKEYPYLRSYVPQIGDRVYMRNFNGSYIIFDAISFEIEPIDNVKNLDNKVKAVENKVNEVEGNVNTQLNRLKTEIETSVENKYATKEVVATKIASNLNADVNGNHNIDYMYVDPGTKILHVRRKNGQWTSYAPRA